VRRLYKTVSCPVKFAIRACAPRIRRVVVVDVAGGVDVPRIVRVAAISGAQAHIARC